MFYTFFTIEATLYVFDKVEQENGIELFDLCPLSLPPNVHTAGHQQEQSEKNECLLSQFAILGSLMIVPINVWRNSDQFFGKNYFCSSKFGQVKEF